MKIIKNKIACENDFSEGGLAGSMEMSDRGNNVI